MACAASACVGAGAGKDTDLGPTDSDVADTDAADTDGGDTDALDTDANGADTDPLDSGTLDTDWGPHTGDLPVDTATPLADAVDGPFEGPWVTRGGSRLTVVRMALDGSAQDVFSHFHDTRLDVDCRFEVAEDGRYRCLPTAPYEGGNVVQGPGCVGSGTLLHPTCSALRESYDFTGGGVGCAVPGRSMHMLTVDPSVTTQGFAQEPSGCIDQPIPAGTQFARIATRSIPAWRYARGVPQAVSTGGDVDVVVIRARDGAVQPYGFYDPVRDVPCQPVTRVGDPSEQALCTPANDVSLQPGTKLGYDDATCETPVATAFSVCDDPAVDQGVGLTPPAAAPLPAQRRRTREIRPMGALTPYAYEWRGSWSFGDPTCEPVAGGGLGFGSEPVRALLDPLGPDDLPVLRQVSLAPDAPGVFAWVDADGTPLMPVPATPFADASGTPCAPVWDETLSSVRCVPDPQVVVYDNPEVYFADSTCRQPVVAVNGDAEPGLVTLRSGVGPACFGGWSTNVPAGQRPVVLGEPVELTHAYALWPGWPGGTVNCTLVSLGYLAGPEVPDPVYYEVSDDPRPLDAWPELTLR